MPAKDFYDIAFVLLNHDLVGMNAAVDAVHNAFPGQPVGATLTALEELAYNFTNPNDQGPRAYADQLVSDHPGLAWDQVALDACSAVQGFVRRLCQKSN